MCHLPALPRHKELVSELGPIHARLSHESSIAKRHPVYRCSDVQVTMICHEKHLMFLLSLFIFFLDTSLVALENRGKHIYHDKKSSEILLNFRLRNSLYLFSFKSYSQYEKH